MNIKKEAGKGFTLLEIMISILIIGIITSIVFVSNLDESREQAVNADLKSQWVVNEGKYIDKLVNKWSFDEGTGTDTKDSSTFGMGGVINGTATWASEGDCISGRCLQFDGTDDYVLAADINGLDKILVGDTARTISAWVKPNNIDPGGTIVAINGSSHSFVVELSTSSSNVYLFRDGNSSNDIIISGDEIPAVSEWNYIVLTFDGDDWNYYLNGEHKKSGTFATLIDTDPNTISIGRRGSGTDYFNGSIDEVSIYNMEMTLSEIRSNYLTGLNDWAAGTENNKLANRN